MIEYSDRVLLVGKTREGKSEVARRTFLSAEEPRMVLDPNDSTITDVPGAVTIYGPPMGLSADEAHAQMAARLREHDDAGTVRVVPMDPARTAEYDAAYQWAFTRYPMYVWLDEAGDAGHSSAWLRKYLTQGGKRQCGHIACHTRPREVDRNLIAQADVLMVFRLPNPDDVKVVAKQVGIPAGELNGLLSDLPRYGFLVYSERQDTITAVPPLEL